MCLLGIFDLGQLFLGGVIFRWGKAAQNSAVSSSQKCNEKSFPAERKDRGARGFLVYFLAAKK